MKSKNILKVVFSSMFLLVLYSISFAQGIRKHYTELTNQEMLDYKSGLDILDNNNIRVDFADFHVSPGGAIHGVPEFLSWHRQFLLEYEQELQNEYDYLTIPYWDFTGDSDPSGVNSASTNSPLWSNSQINALGWSENFLAEYNGTYGLGREFSGSLPSSTTVDNLLNITSFSDYRPPLERDVHNPPHRWVGGEMGTMDSPRDPIFYFHHAMIDKLWQLWEEEYGASVFSDNVMPTFDGSVSAYGFESVNQNNIVDSRDLGIFYSDPNAQLTVLETYAITNIHRPIEKFVYQYEIKARNDFQIPNGKNAQFRSCNIIELLPGFEASTGSTFLAKIDEDCDFSTDARIANPTIDKDKKPISRKTIQDQQQVTFNNDLLVKNYPNPFSKETTFEFELQEATNVHLEIHDITGKSIALLIDNKAMESGIHTLNFDAGNLSDGIYMYRLSTTSENITKKLVVKR